MNSWQVQNYLQEYSEMASVHGFSSSVLQGLGRQLPSMHMKASGRQVEHALLHLRQAADLARTKWTQFNVPLTVFGIAMMLASVVSVLASGYTALFLHKSLLVLKAFLRQPLAVRRATVLIDILSRHEAAAVCIMLIRAAMSFSNSLVLAEAQVAQYLLCSCSLIACSTVCSQLQLVHMRTSRTSTAIPCMSPYSSAFGILFMLFHGAIMQWQSDRLSSHVIRGAVCICNGFAATWRCITSLTEPSAIVQSVRVFRQARRALVVTAIALWAILSFHCFTSSALKVSDQCLAFSKHDTHSFFAYVFAWLVALFVWRTLHCKHGGPLQQAFSGSVLWELVKVLLAAAAVLLCSYVLVSIGAIDRVGISPFHKADQAHSSDARTSNAQKLAPNLTDFERSPWGNMGNVSSISLWLHIAHPVPALLCLVLVLRGVRVVYKRHSLCASCTGDQWRALQSCKTVLSYIFSWAGCTSDGLMLDEQVRGNVSPQFSLCRG